jgi:hypothetical protein
VTLPIIPQHELLKRETCGQCVHFPGLPESVVETIRTLGWKRCELGGVHTAKDAPVETITFGRCKHFEPASPATKRSMTVAVADRLQRLREQADLDASELADGGLESLDHG